MKRKTNTWIAGSKIQRRGGGLANAFVFMKGQLKENIRQLLETTARNERIQGELNIAKDIQLGLLPKIFPPFPTAVPWISTHR